MVPSAKDLQSVEEIAMTFPTQIRYLTETETETQRRSETETDREATSLQIRQITAQLSHFYINTAQGVANAGREANVSNVASESLLSRCFFSSSLV